jgi:hypothetical protein
MRTHRIFGTGAVCHAAAVATVIVVMFFHGRFPSSSLWVAFVTSWLVWPVVLLLHRGRSLRRVVIPLLISLPLLWPAWRDYQISAPAAVGLPLGVRLSPRDLYDYFTAYRAGHAQAEKDLHAGLLAIETYGLAMPAAYTEILGERYHVQVRQIAGCTDVTAKVLGRAEGYNKLSKVEVRKRLGDGSLKAPKKKPLRRGVRSPRNRSNRNSLTNGASIHRTRCVCKRGAGIRRIVEGRGRCG